MKTFVLKFIIATIFFVSLFNSCKKTEIRNIEPLTQQTTVSENLQRWYNKTVDSFHINSTNSLELAEPDWNTTVKADKYVITKAKITNMPNVDKYLVVENDEKGNIFKGYNYVVINSNTKGLVNTLYILIQEINNEKITLDFNGAILKYDLANKKINSFKYNNGKKEEAILELAVKDKLPIIGTLPEINPASAVPGSCITMCDDYYLVTYDTQTGEILDVEYLGDVCVCISTSGGSGGGNGGGGNTTGIWIDNQGLIHPFAPNNFRYNLKILTGQPNQPSNIEAHHIFPQGTNFTYRFTNQGINIHDPQYGFWWQSPAHQQSSYAYNFQWSTWLSSNPNATKAEILAQGKIIMASFGFMHLYY